MKKSRRSQDPKDFQTERPITLNGNVEYTITLPSPPRSYKDIANWDKSVRNQRWEIPPEILTQDEYEDLDADQQVEYLKLIYKWRTEGYWFYNHGNIEYLTGDHFFYLAFWRIDGIVPYWKDSDSTFFYIEKHCTEKEDCLGWMQVTNRRDGKTGKATSILYNRISLNYNANGGIQSKTNPDAKGIFRKMVLSWQKLPAYLKPVDTGETYPTQALRFQEPSKRSSKTGKKEYKDVLNSLIDYKPAVEEAYDGSKLKYYYDDEFGKTTEVNVLNRWHIVKECLVQGETVIGKSLHTTTAEEMEEKGGQAAKDMWDESDLSAAREAGREMTISGLLRWFKPATLGLEGYIDEYGYSVVEDPEKPLKGINGKLIKQGSKSYIEKRRRGLQGSTLASEKRKYPLSIDEAFIEEGKLSPFDVIRLNEQLSYISTLEKNPVIRGNFYWEDYDKRIVGFRPTEDGRWNVLWMPPVNDRNKRIPGRRGYMPGNHDKLVSGVDPFDHRLTTDNKKSNAASYVYRKFDPFDSHYSNCFVCEYVNRPATPEMFYDDMVKQSVFYGTQILAENNKIGIINHFIREGFEDYLMRRPDTAHTDHSKRNQKEYGIPMSGEAVRQRAVEITDSHIYQYTGLNYENDTYGNVYFPNLLKCWIKFNPQKWTDYDEFVGSALCLFAKDARTRGRTINNDRSVGSFVRTFNNRR